MNQMYHLNSTQKKEVVACFQAGEKHYTKIAKKLDLPYPAINKFMTQWKKTNGILKTRTNKKGSLGSRIGGKKKTMKYLAQALTKAQLNEQEKIKKSSGSNILATIRGNDELSFLRRFYVEKMTELATA